MACEVRNDEHDGELYEVPISGKLVLMEGGKAVAIDGYKAKLCRKHKDLVLCLDKAKE